LSSGSQGAPAPAVFGKIGRIGRRENVYLALTLLGETKGFLTMGEGLRRKSERLL
jgi:hypothetical protein